MQRIVIIGNGVAGATCALTARERSPRASITMISDESDYFFSRTALMYAFMDRLDRRDLEPYERKVWPRQNIDLIRGRVVDLDAGARTVTLAGGRAIPYDALLLATGSVPRRMSVPGLAEVKEGLVNFVSLQDLDNCERATPSTKRAVVVGGGLIGIELVECLRHHDIDVTFLVREPWYWPIALAREEGELVTAALVAHGVDVRHGDELATVENDAAGRVAAVTTTTGERIACQMLGICIGVEPCIDWLKDVGTPPRLGRGIIVDDRLRTSLPDVFSAGDCAEIHFPDNAILPAGTRTPLVEQIWYSAKRQGDLAGRNMTGAARAYRPPIFFNSAKLLDIEYTTVGEVNRVPPGTRSLYRVAAHGPYRTPISQRIVFEGKNNRVIGFNMLGSRWDHSILSRWIEEERTADWVLAHLAEAQFDVEFGRADLGKMMERELETSR